MTTPVLHDAPPLGPQAPRPPARDPLIRFEELVARSERLRVRALPFDELRELSRSYREQSARLAQLRDRDADPDAIRHLNALCLRAYAFLYAASDDAARRRAREPLARRVVATLARTWRVQAIAWLLLALGTGLGAGLATQDEAALYVMLPGAFGYSPETIDELRTSPEARAEFLKADATATAQDVAFGSWLFTHNVEVGLMAFASGMFAGIPSALLQLATGMMLGAFAVVFLADPWPVDFLAWLLPHAIPELTAITLCCAAGLLLGAGVAAPGRRKRSDAIRENARPALALFGASLPLFAVAALTESFLRESALGPAPRLVVAGCYAVLLAALLASARRAARARGVDSSWLADALRDTRFRAPGNAS